MTANPNAAGVVTDAMVEEREKFEACKDRAAASIAQMVAEWQAGPGSESIPANLIRRRLDRFLLASSPALEPAPAGEVVAWRFRLKMHAPYANGEDGWTYGATEPHPSQAHLWEVQPLYASTPPAPPAPIQGAAEERDLPDDLRAPLHSLQADLDYLVARLRTEDDEVCCLLKESIGTRLSHIEEAAYRLCFSARPSSEAPLRAEIERLREEVGQWRAQARLWEQTAQEAKAGLDALEEIDAAWDAFGTAGNRKTLTLAEQIASQSREIEAAEANLAAQVARNVELVGAVPRNDLETSAALLADTPLNAARREFSSWAARIDQAGQQRRPVSPIECRRMEFQAVAAIIRAALSPATEGAGQ